MKSTCSYLRLKMTFFAFEDVGCTEVMGCVKKMSQTVPAAAGIDLGCTGSRGNRLLSPEKARPRSGIRGSNTSLTSLGSGISIPRDPCCWGSLGSPGDLGIHKCPESGIRDPASTRYTHPGMLYNCTAVRISTAAPKIP